MLLVAGQRPHVYVASGIGSPVHVATAVTVGPTTGLPCTTGLEVNCGALSARAVAGSHNRATRAATDTGTWRRRRANIPIKYASIVGGVGRCAGTMFGKERPA